MIAISSALIYVKKKEGGKTLRETSSFKERRTV